MYVMSGVWHQTKLSHYMYVMSGVWHQTKLSHYMYVMSGCDTRPCDIAVDTLSISADTSLAGGMLFVGGEGVWGGGGE